MYFYSGIVNNKTYDLTLSGIQDDSPGIKFSLISYSVTVKAKATTNSGTNNQQVPTPNQPIPPTTPATANKTSTNECNDLIDNDRDGKADHKGVYENGIMKYEPDPSCFSPTATIEKPDDVASTIIPCTDKCTFSDVFKLINNLLVFFLKELLIPIFIILIMYAGFKYITAQGNPSKKADLKKLFGNMILGLVLILCSWLIVHTILVALGYTEGLLFFD